LFTFLEANFCESFQLSTPPSLSGAWVSRTKEKAQLLLDSFFGAGKETQTPGLFLGKEALYQLSYARVT
jgi:hypothetical protein